jgi:hypothetical protein
MEFDSKNQKGKPCEMDLPLLKNDITNILGPQKPVIYSRNPQSGSITGLLEISVI